MVQASVLSSADGARLTALVQESSENDETTFGAGAPDAAVYEGHSASIIDTLENLLDKAQTQLAGARQTETTATHNYHMLKQSLEDEIKFANKDKAEAEKDLASSNGDK